MPTLETIRRLKVEATTSGVAQTTAELNKLSAAQGEVAKSSQVMGTVTEQTSRKQLSVEAAYKRQTLALDEAARKQDQYAKAARVADQALAQGVITADQHAQRLGDLGKKYEQASVANQAFAKATSSVSGQLVAMAAGFGPVSVFLSALGPWGIAAAVGLNLVSGALNAARESAATAGQKARDLVELSEVTKLSINELRGLKQAAAQFGVGEDQIETWLTKAAISMETARTGSGELADALRAVDPAFLTALNNAGTMAERLDVLSQAAAAAKQQGKEVALYWRDVFGRGSGRADVIMEATQAAGGIAAVGNAMKQYGGAAAEEIKHRAELSEENKKLTKEYDALKASMLQATTVLQAENLALQIGIDLMKKRTEETRKRTEAEAELARQLQAAVQQRVEGSDAEQIVNRARQRNKIPGAGSSQETLQLGRQQDVAILAMLANAAEKAAAKVDLLAEAKDRFATDTLWITALGDAATFAERLVLVIDKLNVAFEANAFGLKDTAEAQQRFNRALAAADVASQIQEIQARIGILGSLASVTDIVRLKELEITRARQQGIVVTKEQERELLALARVQAELAQVAPGTYTRQLAELEALKAAYPGLTAAQATAARELDNQLRLAQAVTGQQKAMVQYAIDYQTALSAGTAPALALAEAAKKLAINMAEANAAVDRQIHSLQQQTELIRASLDGTTELVKQQQAYSDAVKSGASPEMALQLVAAMRQQVQAEQEVLDAKKQKAALDEQELANIKRVNAEEAANVEWLKKQQQYVNEIYAGMHQLLDEMSFSQPGGPDNQGMQGGATGSVTAPFYQELLKEVDKLNKQGYQAEIKRHGISAIDARDWYVESNYREVDAQRAKDAKINEFEMQRVEAQIAGNKAAEISAVQGELGFYQGQPRTLENLQQIKSLTDALKELTDATQAQTATLSDIYGAGHAGRIGYYNEGTTTAVIGQPTITSNPPVWGNSLPNPVPTPAPANSNDPYARYRGLTDMYLGIQHFAEGGTVTRPTLALVGEAGPEDITPVGKRGGPPTVVQNFNIMMPARSDLGDRSTQRQMFEGVGRRASVAR